MATPVNPYTGAENLETTLVEDAAMRDTTSNAGSSSTTAGSNGQDPPQEDRLQEREYQKSNMDEEAEGTVKFNEDFQLPPSFSQPISEETLCNDKHQH